MPVVPLGQLSKATFKIINDGYENLIVKYTIDNLQGDVPLEIKLKSD